MNFWGMVRPSDRLIVFGTLSCCHVKPLRRTVRFSSLCSMFSCGIASFPESAEMQANFGYICTVAGLGGNSLNEERLLMFLNAGTDKNGKISLFVRRSFWKQLFCVSSQFFAGSWCRTLQRRFRSSSWDVNRLCKKSPFIHLLYILQLIFLHFLLFLAPFSIILPSGVVLRLVKCTSMVFEVTLILFERLAGWYSESYALVWTDG